MTKKLTVPFFVAVYLISLAAGFGFAGIRKANAITPASTPNRQSAWIMVRVDDMTVEQPRLVSVWAMFLTFSPGPQVFFKPLYSNEASLNKYAKLEKAFSVAADRTISRDFIEELNRLVTYQSGMVLLDDIGFKSFTSWFTRPITTSEARPFVPQTGSFQPIGEEAKDYSQICRSLEKPIRPDLDSLPWRNMFPNHILAYPTLQGLINVWERLIISDLDAHCEVIPIP
jgi:hypothetical protein